MKFLVFLGLLPLVMGSEGRCGYEKVEACIENLLSSLPDTTLEKVCKDTRTSVDCMRDAIDNCQGEDSNAVIEEALQQLEMVLKEDCEEKDVMGSEGRCDKEKIEACVENFLSFLLGVTTLEEVCKETRASVDCMRDAIDNCQGEDISQMEKGLQELEMILKGDCEEKDVMGSEGRCDKEKIEACMENFLSFLLGVTTLEEICKETRASVACMRDAIDNCQGEDINQMEKGLQELEMILKEDCEEKKMDVYHGGSMLRGQNS